MKNELLAGLGQERPIFWYCDDAKSGKKPFETLEPDLDWASNCRMGVFFAVNELGDLRNDNKNLRHDLNVNRPLASFADFDKGTHEEQMDHILKSPIEPSAIVKSGHGYHCYWFLIDSKKEDLPRWSKLQESIAAYFGSDPIHDYSRIMRLPDSWHCKDEEKKKVTLEKCDPTLRYSLDELIMEFPAIKREDHQSILDKLVKDGVLAGGRNSSSTKIVGSLLSKYPPTQWESVVWPIFKLWNDSLCTPPLPESEIRVIFDSISKKEQSKRAIAEKGITTFGESEMVAEVVEREDEVIARIPIEDGIVQFSFTDIEQSSADKIDCVLSTSLIIPGSFPRPFILRINALSGSAREGYARQLLRSFGKGENWDLLLSTACTAAIEHLGSRDLSLNLSDIDDSTAPMLFDPFLVKDGANLVFGDGGTGKTYFCLRLALSLASGKDFLGYAPKEKLSTLFIDYEDGPETASFRITKLCSDPALGIEKNEAKQSIRYLNPKGAPLYSIVPALRKVIRKHNIGLILVDSVASACGAEPEKAESASRYYNALKSLGITSLSIAHVTKSQGESQDKAFGSVYWHNLARNTWNLQGEDEETEGKNTIEAVMGESAKQLGLFHRKFNSGKRSRPIGMRISYSDKYTKFELGKEDFWNKNGRRRIDLRDLILALFKKMPKMTTQEIVDSIRSSNPEIAVGSIRNCLTEMVSKMVIFKTGGKGGIFTQLKMGEYEYE